MNWLDLAITGGFWILGIMLARRRRTPAREQIIFTVIMFGGLLVGALLQKRKVLGLDEGEATGLLIVLALIVLGATFFRKWFFTPQTFAGIGALLVLSTFLMTGYVVTFFIWTMVGTLLLGASILALKRKKPSADRPT